MPWYSLKHGYIQIYRLSQKITFSCNMSHTADLPVYFLKDHFHTPLSPYCLGTSI